MLSISMIFFVDAFFQLPGTARTSWTLPRSIPGPFLQAGAQASSLYPHTISKHCWVPFLVFLSLLFIIFYLSKGRGVLKKLQKTNDLNGFPQQDSWRPLHHLTTGNQTQVPQLLLLQLLEICRYTLNLIHGIRNQLNLMKLHPMHTAPHWTCTNEVMPGPSVLSNTHFHSSEPQPYATKCSNLQRRATNLVGNQHHKVKPGISWPICA